MVGAVKRWLGIDALERENLTLAKSAKAQSIRISATESDLEQALSEIDGLKKGLTAEPAKGKIVPKPRHTTWKTFRSAAERANDPQEQEA